MAKSGDEALFGAACLKVALDRRGGPSEIYEETLQDLGLDPSEVEAYLAEHRDVVEAALEAHGRTRS
jgi:hypothetical protein